MKVVDHIATTAYNLDRHTLSSSLLISTPSINHSAVSTGALLTRSAHMVRLTMIEFLAFLAYHFHLHSNSRANDNVAIGVGFKKLWQRIMPCRCKV